MLRPPIANMSFGNSTRAVHGDVKNRRQKPSHSLTTPIVRTSTYTFADTADLLEFMANKSAGDKKGREQYGRYSNPTIQAVEHKLALLDGGSDAVMFSSGMAAVTTTMLAVLSSGTHVVYTDDAYSKTRQFCTEFLPRMGIEATCVPMGNYDTLEAAIQENTRLIVSESPTNPYLRVADMERLVAIAKRHENIKTYIDATFATPIYQKPLEFGIDFVVHSATKYFSGHNDLLAGVVVGDKALLSDVRKLRGMLGCVSDAMVAYEVERGLKTLALRMERQTATAMQLAQFLQGHPLVERVWYPGLACHPDHAIAKAQMSGYGGVVSLEIDPRCGETPERAAANFIDGLRLIQIAPSLGGTETLVMQPAVVSYFDMSPEERAEIGMKDNLVRIALGVEDSADLIQDVIQALEGLQKYVSP